MKNYQNETKLNIILFDDDKWQDLLPLTFTRPICELRVGILTIKEKWERHLNGFASYITQDYLSEKFALNILEDNYLINSTYLPNNSLTKYIISLDVNEAIYWGDDLICARIPKEKFNNIVLDDTIFNSLRSIDISKDKGIFIQRICHPYDIFQFNDIELINDFDIITSGRISQDIPQNNTIIGYPNKIFLEEGADVQGCFLNASKGPIYLGKNTLIMEGSMIRGGFAACEGSVVKMGTKIYGATTLGPYCKLGGEVNNSVLLANSNKGHDGYLGNSVLGEWCNLGADTNNSNLKNNYLPVKLWSYTTQNFQDTGLQFCGLIMGDHSKSAISTMFNTGTVVGVASNIFGPGFPRNYIPSFSWGGASGFISHKLEKALETAQIVMNRRNKNLSTEDIHILKHIYSISQQK